MKVYLFKDEWYPFIFPETQEVLYQYTDMQYIPHDVYLKEIPDELYNDYIRVKNEMKEIQKKLREYYEDKQT
jgi:hypothetical protein